MCTPQRGDVVGGLLAGGGDLGGHVAALLRHVPVDLDARGGELALDPLAQLGGVRVGALAQVLRVPLGLLALGGRLGLGARPELARGALRRDAQLRRLVLDARAQRAQLALERAAALALLGRDRALDACGLALGGADELLRAALRGQERALGLRRGRRLDLVGLPTRGGDDLGDLVLRAGAQLPRGELGARQGVGRLGVRLGDDVRRLLLGGPQQLLDARAQTGVGGPLGLAQLAVRLGQLAGHLHGASVEGLDLGAGVGESLLQPGDTSVDGFAFVAAEVDDGEGGPGVGHEQSSWALWLRGAASDEALVDFRSPPVRIRVFTVPRTCAPPGMHARADPSTRSRFGRDERLCLSWVPPSLEDPACSSD